MWSHWRVSGVVGLTLLGLVTRALAGGYVAGSEPLLLEDASNPTFNNEIFSTSVLTEQVNNSAFSLQTGDPIATVTGNVFHDEEDLRIRGRGLDYLFTRTYNSRTSEADPDGIPMGRGWTHSYNARLIARDHGREPGSGAAENDDGLVSSIVYVNERGGESVFGVSGAPAEPSTWVVDDPRGVFDTLDLDGAPASYRIVFRNGTEYVFGGADLSEVGAVARLERIRDPYGDVLTLGYDNGRLTSVTDDLGVPGRTGLAFEYHADGRLSRVSDWVGRSWTFGYDAAGNLRSVVDPLGEATWYDYGEGSGDPSLMVRNIATVMTGRALAVTDINGDGDIDLIVGDEGGLSRVTLYTNDGSGAFSPVQVSPNGKGVQVGAADFDGDGRVDIVAHRTDVGFSNTQKVSWFRNQTIGWGLREIIEETAQSEIGVVEPADLDGDGDPDLLLARVRRDEDGDLIPGSPSSPQHGVFWLENDGSGTFDTVPAHVIEAGTELQDVFVADLDGDGDLDVVLAESGKWEENDGDGAFTEHPLPLPASAELRLAEDFDGDGDPDLLSMGDAERAWYENVAAGTSYVRHEIGPGGTGSPGASYLLADVDADGDLDLVERNPFLDWYERLDAGSAGFRVRQGLGPQAGRGFIASAAGDLDGDGDVDFAHVADFVVFTDHRLAWFENETRGPQGALTRVTRPADRDGDGEGDVQTTFDYYANGRGLGNADRFGHGEQVDYDLFRKRTRITGPRGFVTSHFFDGNGELTKLTRPDGGVMTARHTDDGRRWERTNPLGFTTQYAYCAARTLDGCASDVAGNVTLERDPLGNTIEYDYDLVLFDQITRRKDENGAEHLAVYYTADDPATGAVRGKLHQRRIAQLGSFSDVLLQELTYNPDGTVAQRIDHLDPADPGRKRTTTFTYTDNGLNVQEILVTGSDGTSRRKTFTHDALGRVETETLWRRAAPDDATQIPLTTRFAYDDADRVIRVTDPLGNETETDYDANGNATEVRFIGVDPETGAVQPPRVVERRTYDAADRLTEVRDVLDAATTFAHDEAGNRTAVTDPTGVTRHMEYDERDRLVAVTDGNGHRREMRYDLNGRLVAETDANGNKTTFTYDAAGRRTSRTDPLGNTATFRYDGVGNRVGRTSPNANADPGNPDLVNAQGESETREYDELGRLVRVIDAQDHVTRFEYDLLGNRTKVTDAKGQVTELVHDDLGRLVRVIDPVIETPEDRQEVFAVDEAGNVWSRVDPEGRAVLTTYDALSRPTERRLLPSGGVETLAYDAFGNVKRVANGEVVYTFTHDAKDRLLTKTDSRLARSLAFEYDAADRLIRKTDYQGDVTHFLYDGTGRLVAEQSDAFLQVSYHYDPAGQLVNRILSSGAQTDYAFDPAGRLTSLTHRSADGTVVRDQTYTHDANGNIESDGAFTYTYDPLDRLLEVDHPASTLDRSYTYDAVGNRDTLTTVEGGFDYVYGAGSRLLEIRRVSDGSLVRSFDYDATGAVTAKRDGTGTPLYTLGRDALGRVQSATGPGFANAFGYDPRGIRVRRDDSAGPHLFHLEGDRLEAVYDASGALRERYLRGSVIDEVVNADLFDAEGRPTNLTYHHDPVTSVVAVTGHAGTLDWQVFYTPFGEELGSTGTSANTLRFTGRERDPDTGLYYFRARYYDPEIGRFLSEDPLGFDGGDVNLYAYAANNPLRFNDPSGNCPVCITAGIGALIGAGGGALTAAVQGKNASEILFAAGAGAVAGGLIGSGVGFLAGEAAVATSVAAFNAEILGFNGALALGGAIEGAGAIAASGISAFAGSVAEQTFFGPGVVSENFANVNFDLAQNVGIAGAAAGVLPAVIPAASTTAPFAITTGGGALLGVAGETISLGTGLLASEVLVPDPVSIGPPDDFNPTFNFPSSNLLDPVVETYCVKCF